MLLRETHFGQRQWGCQQQSVIVHSRGAGANACAAPQHHLRDGCCALQPRWAITGQHPRKRTCLMRCSMCVQDEDHCSFVIISLAEKVRILVKHCDVSRTSWQRQLYIEDLAVLLKQQFIVGDGADGIGKSVGPIKKQGHSRFLAHRPRHSKRNKNCLENAF